jgi:integrase
VASLTRYQTEKVGVFYLLGKSRVKAAKLPKDFRPLHGLRHTFASVAVTNGVPLSHVQKLLTHKDPTLTQRYARLEDHVLKRAAEAVGNFWIEDTVRRIPEHTLLLRYFRILAYCKITLHFNLGLL